MVKELVPPPLLRRTSVQRFGAELADTLVNGSTLVGRFPGVDFNAAGRGRDPAFARL